MSAHKTHNNYLYSVDMLLNDETVKLFQGIKYVCMQGSSDRSKVLTRKLAKLILGIEDEFFTPRNLFPGTRFTAYKVANVLCVSHGMGTVSIHSLLDTITQLLRLADNSDLEYIRIGTSGGLNIAAGSIVITDTAFMPNLVANYKMNILGYDKVFPTQMDIALSKRILAAQPPDTPFKLYFGNSIAADDFYMGQARFDGVIKPKYDLAKRQKYFEQIMARGIYNFEMESTVLAAFCNRASIPATMIAVTLLDRLRDDQVTASAEELADYANRVHTVAINYILDQVL